MKRLMLLAVLLRSFSANAADIFWSPTSFEDGSPAVIYLTDEINRACPAMWYRAHAINKKTHAVNRDHLCWTLDPSGTSILTNRTTGVSQALSPVGFVRGSQDGSPSLFNNFMRQHISAMRQREQQIQATIDEEMPPPAPVTQPEKNRYAYTHGHPWIPKEQESQAAQEQSNEQVVNPYAKYQNTNSLAK